jgi:hypothetical protein
MSDLEADLRTTSDAILAEADKLVNLEERKRTLGSDDTERVTLSAEIAQLGRRVERATAAERELAQQAADS